MEEPSLPSIRERADQWFVGKHTGLSSVNLLNHMLDNRCSECDVVHGGAHPWDVDDFGRCHRLLELIPEWKDQLHIMTKVSTTWSKLVENWGEITRLYESDDLVKANDLIKSCTD